MKQKTNFKTMCVAITLLMISFGNVNAQCDYSDDFVTLEVPNTKTQNISPTVTTEAGWVGTNVKMVKGCDGCATNSYNAMKALESPEVQGIELQGQSAVTSTLVSPLLQGGCTSLSFNYLAHVSGSSNIKIRIEIEQNNQVVWSDNLENNGVTGNTVCTYSFSDINVMGDYKLRFINPDTNSPDLSNNYLIWNICLTNNIPAVSVEIPAHNYQFNVPKDATVFVGDKDQATTVAGNYLTKHYVPFTEKQAVHIAETDTSKIWYYDLPAPKNSSGGFNYRVTRAGKAPHVGLFKPKASTTVESDTALLFIDAQLSAHNAKDIDHDVNSLNGRNVADMFININAQGYLTLPLQADTTFQLIHTRNWQAIDTDVNNYFIEPDFHYTVVDENGNPSNDVLTIDDQGLITPVGAGTAIVLVDYDAMLTHHTTNVGITAAEVKTHPAFFSASWGENTAVFVVSVAQPEANITTNMNLNAYWAQDGTDKTEGVAIDAEHDVLYFEAGKGSFAYTFKPEGVNEVLLATPIVNETATAYSGFRTDSVTVDAEGSYTVRLGFGRNIVKLVSATGSEYQVITAKPVTYTVSNLTHPDEQFSAGDEISVLFNTLYHPSNKMSGIYNMSAGIQYTGDTINFPLILGPGQYTFASRAQEYKITIPADYEGNEFTLTNGVIKVKGFGSYYGAHRKITLQSGVSPNLNASVREAYFGALPDITVQLAGKTVGIEAIANDKISVYPNPFTDYIVIDAISDGNVTIYDLSGKVILSATVQAGNNRINTSTLNKGVYVLKQGSNIVKIVK